MKQAEIKIGGLVREITALITKIILNKTKADQLAISAFKQNQLTRFSLTTRAKIKIGVLLHEIDALTKISLNKKKADELTVSAFKTKLVDKSPLTTRVELSNYIRKTVFQEECARNFKY